MLFSLFKKKAPVLVFKNVRVFGKLGGFADFVRYRSADPEAVNIDSWVNTGLSSLMNQGYHSALEEDWTFSSCELSDKGYHLITIMNSQDKSGRLYPLVLLSRVEVDWLKDYVPSLPLLFKPLQDLGKQLQDPNISSQTALIETVANFEKQSFPLSKRDLLEQRIKALKFLNQDQAWGAWFKNQPSMNPSAWMNNQIKTLKTCKKIELPMGSAHDVQEASYWLQLQEDIRGVSAAPIHYYWLSSSQIKKIILEYGQFTLPSFHELFRPCGSSPLYSPNDLEPPYDGQMSLLSALDYWKRGAA